MIMMMMGASLFFIFHFYIFMLFFSLCFFSFYFTL